MQLLTRTRGDCIAAQSNRFLIGNTTYFFRRHRAACGPTVISARDLVQILAIILQGPVFC
jgi:hypothetical protein